MVKQKGPALLFLPALHLHNFLNKYFSNAMMEWAVEQGRCDVKEATVADELIETMCDSKKWNINNMNASEWGINLHPVNSKEG